MKVVLPFFLCLLLLPNLKVSSQENDVLKAINSTIWANFTKAFEELDYELFSSIHSENLVRVNGDFKSIKNKSEYVEGYKKWWQNKSLKQTIHFRFLERIHTKEKASERGIYKLTRDPGTSKEKNYFGKFHVILKTEDGQWKIVVDYDSSENESIDETSYNEAFHIEDFSKYQN